MKQKMSFGILALLLIGCIPAQEAAVTAIVQEIEVPVTVLAEVTREVEVVQTVEVMQEVEVTVLVEQEVTTVVEVFPSEMLPDLLVGGIWDVFAFFEDGTYIVVDYGEREIGATGNWELSGNVLMLNSKTGACAGRQSRYTIGVEYFDGVIMDWKPDSCGRGFDTGYVVPRSDLPDWVEPLLEELE